MHACRSTLEDPTITPQQISPPPAPSIEQLHRENNELRQQVKSLQAKVIDLQVQLAWLRHAATPEGSEKVSDEAFLRRAYLDLMGIPPTAEDARKFLNDADAEKRGKLIDRLLASPGLPNKFVEDAKALWPKTICATPAKPAEPAKPARPTEPALPIVPGKAEESPALQQRLKALDVREAEVNLKAARVHYERLNALTKTGNGAITQQELLAAAAELQRAEVSLELTKVRGDRLKEQQLEVHLAEAFLRATQVNLQRISKLVQSGQITQIELDSAKFEVEKAEIALERQRAKLEALQ